jgi:hypothetical protein
MACRVSVFVSVENYFINMKCYGLKSTNFESNLNYVIFTAYLVAECRN